MKGVVFVFLALLILGCAAEPTPPAVTPILETTGTIEVTSMEFTKERVTLTAADNTALVGNYYDAEGEKSVILLHQLDLDKESWEVFARKLQRDGYTVIALDLRGHGESTGTWQSFDEVQFREMLSDVEAAATYLRDKEKHVKAVLGASIGANTAFRYSSKNRIPAVLLSPGLEYKGIDINAVTSTAPTLIIVGGDDTYSHESSIELDENNLLGEHTLVVLGHSNKHGAYLLEEQGVTGRIEEFLAKYS